MFCTKCGFQLSDDACFCARCGTALTPISGGAQPAQPQYTPQPAQPQHNQPAGSYPAAYGAPAAQPYASQAASVYGDEQVSCPFCGSSTTYVKTAINGGTHPYLNKRQCAHCCNTFRRVSDIRMEQQLTDTVYKRYGTFMYVAAGILAVCAVLLLIMGSIRNMDRVMPFLIICAIVAILAVPAGAIMMPSLNKKCQARLRDEEAALRRAPYFKE